MTPTATAPTPHVARPHAAPVDDVLAELAADPGGLTTEAAAERRRAVGPNELHEEPPVPLWRRFLAQFEDRLILVLLAAAVVAFVVSGELKTPLVVLAVVVLNATIGFVQEQRAEQSLDALRRMVVHRTRVLRDGQVTSVEATELVPGDVVVVEAGDRVPADGRLLRASSLEVDESALTGESQPVPKDATATVAADAAVGDRSTMVHMGTAATRGRGELLVTATGMQTEIGRIATLLQGAGAERSPLQRQLDRLASTLAKLAGVIVAAVVAIGLLRGQPLSDVLLTAVALAVAAIPEGLPAVTAVTLAVGVSKMARQHAIVKRLASVETLGCTSVICSDKTGTLTLNEMTAVTLVSRSRTHAVDGSGYAPHGSIEHLDDGGAALDEVLEALVLCSDAVVRDDGDGWAVVGDPTEGALVAMAAKGGVDAVQRRRDVPRLAEVPFDSARKYMATAHPGPGGSVRLLVKGAPDVLLELATETLDADGRAVPLGDVADHVQRSLDAMADRGERVIAIARRDIPDVDADSFDDASAHEAVGVLCILALVGIVDPPRPEARVAIEEARAAGIRVTMITGDHAATAAAIAGQLGLPGDVVPGRELDALDDDELDRRLPTTGVFARVSPEHKLRLVAAYQRTGNVVAMTGDGVNDAPALKQADIGVAMGITGTDVTKEAATMVLTDDNFATIVGAVRRGRTIYDNIVTFVRFQLSTTVGFALLFLLAGIVGIADGKPFAAIAILWINLVMDGPPAMALGLDPPGRDVMQARPRPIDEPVLTRPRIAAIAVAATTMALGTLLVLATAPGPDPHADTATVAGTMAFTTFVLFQFFNALNARSDHRSVFVRDSLRNRWLWASLVAVLLLQVAAVHVGVLQGLFDTTSMTVSQWAWCALVASSVLWIEEIRKAVVRRRLQNST